MHSYGTFTQELKVNTIPFKKPQSCSTDVLSAMKSPWQDRHPMTSIVDTLATEKTNGDDLNESHQLSKTESMKMMKDEMKNFKARIDEMKDGQANSHALPSPYREIHEEINKTLSYQEGSIESFDGIEPSYQVMHDLLNKKNNGVVNKLRTSNEKILRLKSIKKAMETESKKSKKEAKSYTGTIEQINKILGELSHSEPTIHCYVFLIGGKNGIIALNEMEEELSKLDQTIEFFQSILNKKVNQNDKTPSLLSTSMLYVTSAFKGKLPINTKDSERNSLNSDSKGLSYN